MITEILDGQFFVFGSNLAGNHTGGAAKQAKEEFGAEEGIEEGLTGACYAFPTLDEYMQKVSMGALNESRNKLFSTARALPEKIFFLTKVGCGIAGFSEQEIAPLFKDAPSNIIQPDWNV